ncbi:MAG: hypothetical protein DIU78_022930 [Pseudomonadota bacterium]
MTIDPSRNPLLASSDALQELVRHTAPSVVSIVHGPARAAAS